MLETIEIGVLIAVIGGVISLLAFFIGRQSAAKIEGVEKGRLLGDVEHIKETVNTLVATVEANFREANIPALKARIDALEKVSGEYRQSIKRLHERIDSMMKE